MNSSDVDGWLHRLRARVIYAELDEIQESVLRRVIMLPVGLGTAEQRWRTMHGLAHIELHCGNQRWMLLHGMEHQVQRQERQAEVWVADRLTPQEELLTAVVNGMDFGDLAEHFGVPAGRVRFAVELLSRRTAGASA